MKAEIYSSPVKILVVSGGKDFERESFLEIFNSFSDISFDTTSKPELFNIINSLKPDQYNAIIFYDTYQQINDVQKEQFLGLFDLGIGCIFLHHSIVAHQEWDEYENIVGGRYYHDVWTEDGKKYGPSTYKHDQDFNIHILDKNHPVTRDIADFYIRDESYMNMKILPDVIPLLTSDNCENSKYLGWTNEYRNSKIVYLQPGHDHHAYENPSFRLLVRKSILWVSNKNQE